MLVNKSKKFGLWNCLPKVFPKEEPYVCNTAYTCNNVVLFDIIKPEQMCDRVGLFYGSRVFVDIQ